MLFGPQQNQRLWHPPADRGQTVDAGMAGGAQGNEEFAVIETGLPVMHMEPGIPCPAGAADVAVAVEDFLPQPGKTGGRPIGAEVARTAAAGDGGAVPSTIAEEGALRH